MYKNINFDKLPIKDLLYAGLIIFVISTIIANVYNPLWGVIYAFGNFLTLSFLGWLYRETWDDPKI